MLRIEFAPADLVGLRFAHSPMVEVVTSAFALNRPTMFSARPSLDEELRVVAATPFDRVAAEVDAAWAGHPAPPEILRFGTDPASRSSTTFSASMSNQHRSECRESDDRIVRVRKATVS